MRGHRAPWKPHPADTARRFPPPHVAWPRSELIVLAQRLAALAEQKAGDDFGDRTAGTLDGARLALVARVTTRDGPPAMLCFRAEGPSASGQNLESRAMLK
jgi:hypothetical protein